MQSVKLIYILILIAAFLLTLLITPISEMMLLFIWDIAIFNISLFILWILVCFILSFYKLDSSKHPSLTAFLATLFGLLFHTSQLIDVYADGIFRIWHHHFLVRSVDSILVNHDISMLGSIFENYVSSPASPILGGMLSLITGLSSTTVSLFGLVYTFVIVISLYNLIKNIIRKNESGTIFPALIVISMYFIITNLPITGNYAPASLALISLIILLLVKMANHDITLNFTSAAIILLTLTLLCYAGVLYYLPLVFPMLTLYLVGSLLSKVPNHVKRMLMIITIISHTYFVYAGFSFYQDFRVYMNTLLNAFRPEPLIMWTEEAAEGLDLVFKALLWASRLSPLILILVLVGLSYAYKVNPSLRFLIIIGFVGVTGSIFGRFVHAITDYTFRMNTFLLPSAPLGLYYGMEVLKMIFRKIRLKTYASKFFIPSIFSILLISVAASWFFTQLMYPATPKSASDYHYYVRDAFSTSAFLGNMLDYSGSTSIICNWRYGYLFSIYGIDVWWVSSNVLDFRTSRGLTTLFVLSELFKEYSDRFSVPLGDEKWDQLHKLDIIYNSFRSKVYKVL
ncbi:MAG: hypothetical protein QXR45_09320 [Candidatus Bathyarchaeia archaeon]